MHELLIITNLWQVKRKLVEGKHLDFQETYKEFRQQATANTRDSLPSTRHAFPSRCVKRKHEDEEDLLPDPAELIRQENDIVVNI